MKKKNGYFRIFELRGVPVSAHWTLPAGGILISLASHINPSQWIYYCIAFTLLVITHEAGHVLAAAALGLRVFSVEISGMGGICRTMRPRRVRDSVILYSAGLLSQSITFMAALAYIKFLAPPENIFGTAILMTFTFVNAAMFFINLLPQRIGRLGLENDGLVLWRLFLHVFRGHRHPHPPLVVAPPDKTLVFSPETRLVDMPGFRPHGFIHGIEILNDMQTPMEFVVASLTTHLGLSRNEAIVNMLEIHNTGGVLIALPSAQEAKRISEAISMEARTAGHNLICRYAGPEQAATNSQR